MSTDNKRKLYDALSQDYDMGSYEQFCTDIQDDAKRRKLYDATSEEYDYGDYDKFSNQLGFGPAASAEPNAMSKPDVGGVSFGMVSRDIDAPMEIERRDIIADAIDENERLQKDEMAKKAADIDAGRGWDDTKGVWDNFVRIVGGGANESVGSAAPKANVTEHDENMRNLVAERQVLEETRKRRDAGRLKKSEGVLNGTFDLKNNARNIGKGVTDLVTDADFLLNGVIGMQKGDQLIKIDEKIGRGEELTDSELRLVNAALLQGKVESETTVPHGYTAGQTLAEMAPFMAQMALNPANGAASTMAKAAAKQSIKRFGKKAARRIATGVTIAGEVGESAVLANTLQATSTASDIKSRYIGKAYVDENGQIAFDGSKDWSDAIYRGEGAAIIENYTELLGSHFGLMKDGVGELVKTGVTKLGGGKLVNQVSDLVTRIGSTKWAQAIGNIEKRANWNGSIGEMLEEEAGIVLNSMFVGDNKISDLVDPEQQIDIALGVGLFGGFVSGIKTAGYPVARYNARRGLNRADVRASELMGDEWNGLRNSIDDAEEEDLSSIVASVIAEEGMTGQKQRAVVDYARALMTSRGYNISSESVREDGMASAEEVGAEDSFDDGYSATTPQEMVDARLEMERQRVKLVSSMSEDIADEFDADPLDALARTYDPEIREIASKYVNAKMVYDGMIQRVRDDIDGRIAQSDAMIDGRVNRDTGMIQGATLTDGKEVYVVNGNVAMLDDGVNVDVENSDESLIVRDAEGRLEFVAPSQVQSLLAPVDAASEKEAAAEAIRNEIAQSAADKIDGVLHFAPNDVYAVINEDGTQESLTIVGESVDASGVAVDGMVDVMREDGSVVAMNTADIQRMVDESNARRLDERDKARESAEADSGVEAAGAAAEEPRPSALSRIPTDQNGEPLYEQVDADTAWDAFVEQSEGDEEIAREVVADIVAEKRKELADTEKALKSIGDSKPNASNGEGALTVQERIAAKMASKRALTDARDAVERAKGVVEHWQSIGDTVKRRAEAEEAERRRQAEIAAEEARQAAERERADAEEAERLKREALNGVPDWGYDTAADARARGYRRAGAEKVDRQGPIASVRGKEVGVKFSDRDIVKGRVAIIDAGELQPSHIQGDRNPAHFLDEAQPKERNDAASVVSAQKIASNIRPEEITSSVTAYTGAPTVNARGEVIQGNSRSDALRLMYESQRESAQRYRQYLVDHAADFGLTPEQIVSMESPVLVNVVDVDDNEAIRLGQFVAQDTESGGVERIKAKNAVTRMGGDIRGFAEILLRSADDDASFSQLVAANGVDALAWMSQKGYISPTQYNSALDSKGNLTGEAANDLKGILYQSIFQGGSTRLEEMFNKLPAKAQKAILATAYRDHDSNSADRMIGELQQSILAFNEISSFPGFAEAANLKDAMAVVEVWKNQYVMDDVTGDSYLPTEKFSNFALHLVAMYRGGTQRFIQGTLNDLFDVVQGVKEDTLFEEADKTPKSLAEAIKKVLDLDYQPINNKENGYNGSNAVGVDTPQGEEGGRGSVGDASIGEREPGSSEPTDSGGGTVLPVTERGGQGDLPDTQRRQQDNLGTPGDKGVKEWYSSIRLSGELDQNNSPFVLSPDGQVDFGYITKEHNLPEAPIRLSMGDIQNGYIHINFRHGKEIEGAGFSSIEEFVAHVAQNATRIQEGAAYDNEDSGKNETYLLQVPDKHNDTLFVQLSRDGSYWNVNSAGVFNKRFGNRKRNIWSAPVRQSDGSATNSDGSQSKPNAEEGFASTGNPSNVSYNSLPPNTQVGEMVWKDAATTGTAGQPNEEARAVSPNLSDAKVNENFTDKQAGSEKSSDEDFTEEEVKAIVGHTFTHAKGDVVKLSGHTIMPNGKAAFTGTLNGKKGARFMDGLVRQMLEPDKGWKSDVVLPTAEAATIGEQIAAAEAEVNTSPTDKQKEAGNYKMGHVRVGAFDVTIENPKGSVRRGTDATGKKWEQTMSHTYGYIKGTEGVDGDHIDVFLSSDIDGWDGRRVYVVDQYNPDGTFDEHKVMLGFNSEEDAYNAYLSNYESGWEKGRRLDVGEVDIREFEKWVDSSRRKTKAFSEYRSVNAHPKYDRTVPTTPEAQLSAISRIIGFAKSVKNRVERAVIGGITKRQAKDFADNGIEVDESWVHSFESSAVSHNQKHHGNEKIEAERGQIAITEDDYSRIPEILEDYDKVSKSPNKTKGTENEVIIYEKGFGDGYVYYLEEKRDNRKSLAFHTMYKKKKGTDSSDGFAVSTAPITPKATPDNLSSNSDSKDNALSANNQINMEQSGVSTDATKVAEPGQNTAGATDGGYTIDANAVTGMNDSQLSDEAPLSLDDMWSAVKPTSEETNATKEEISSSSGETPAASKPKNPSGNKLVTDEQYAELLAKMRKKMGGQLNMGVDPEILAIGSMMAVYHIEKGARKFTEYVKAMVADLGEKFPARYLKGFYKAAHEMIEDAAPEIAAEMDADGVVNSADIASIINDRVDAMATAAMVVEEEAAEGEREAAERKLKEERKAERTKAKMGKIGISTDATEVAEPGQNTAGANVIAENKEKPKDKKSGKDSNTKGQDNQGNPIDHTGKLIVEDVKSIDEITDDDFNNPTRTIGLPTLPGKVSDAIGGEGRKPIVKRNILNKNKNSHKDLTPADSRKILNEVLYNPDLYGQNQKAQRPYNWILVHLADKNSSVILEVNPTKEHLEIVNWHYLNGRQLEQKKRQAEREGGRILTLSDNNAAGDASQGLSSDSKDNALSSDKQANNKKSSYGNGVETEGTFLGEKEYIERMVENAFNKRKDKSQTREEWEDEDEYISTYNRIADSYVDYISGLKERGELQRMYDAASLGDRIKIRNGVATAGFEAHELIDFEKERQQARRKREERKAERTKAKMGKIGISTDATKVAEPGQNTAGATDGDAKFSVGSEVKGDADVYNAAKGLVESTGIEVVEVSGEEAQAMMEQKNTPFAGLPNRANEKQPSGSVFLSINGNSSSNRADSKEYEAKLQNRTLSAKNKIAKFKNGDYLVNTGSLFGAIKDLGKLLAMDTKGGSRYTIMRTDKGDTVAIRLSDHRANGNNFGRDATDRNLSIVIERKRYDVPDSGIEFTEAVIPQSVFESRPEEVVSAIVNGVEAVLADKPFTLDSSIGTVEEIGQNVGQAHLLHTPSGVVYGWTVGGKVYLNRDAMNPEAPIHEYTHLWDEMVRKENPQLWERGKELMKQTPLWNEIVADSNYADIRDDEDAVASEVHARLTGSAGARLLSGMIDTAKGKGAMATAEAVNVVDSLKRWLTEMLDALKATLGKWSKRNLDELTIEDFNNLTLRDIAEGVNLQEGELSDTRFHAAMSRGREDFDAVLERAIAERGIVTPGLNGKEIRVVDVPRHDFTGTGKQAIEKARLWADSNLIGKNDYHRGQQDGFTYVIDRTTLEKYLSSSSTKGSDNLGVHLAALKMLPEIINESIEAEIHADYVKGNGKRSASNGVGNPDILIHRMFGAVTIDGVLYRVKTTIKEDRNERVTPYNYQVTELELLISGSETSDALSNSNLISAANLLQGVEKSYDPGKKLLEESRLSDVSEAEDVRYRIREDEPPTKTGIGYKVFVLKDGKLYPPMVANPNGESTPVGVWLDADAAPIAGLSKTGRQQVKAGGKGTQGGSGKLAYRPGWHLGVIPYALQFNRKDESTGERELFPKNFVWAEVEYADDVDYQEEAMSYGYNSNGKFQHSYAGLPRLPLNGSYKYRTNPNPETDPWIITGAMKVNRLLTPTEVDSMVEAAGREPPRRQEGAVTDADIERLNDELTAERERSGDGSYSDAEVSMENDPWSKAWGETLRSKREQRAFAKRERERMRAEAVELSERLGVDIEIIEDNSSLEGKRGRSKGWYGVKDGKISVVLGNHVSVADIEKTVLHEAVAHHGLRELLGEHFDEFLDKVYELADNSIKERIALLASRNGWNRRVATEEYLAGLAEDTDFENAKAYNGWWQKIKRAFLDMLSKIGFKNLDTVLTDNELRYILWRSYENMVEPGRYRAFEWEAEDVAMQYSLKVGEYADKKNAVSELSVAEAGEVYELNDRFNNELNRQIAGDLPQGHVYDMGMPSEYLLSTGIARLPIRLSAKILNTKSNLERHAYDLETLRNLVYAIQKPWAIFSYGDRSKAQNMIIGIEDNGRQFLVGISINPTIKGRVLEINSIRNVFPKNNHEWVNWINEGKLLRVDGKKEIQDIIAKLRMNPVAFDYVDLDNAAKIVENFKNPTIREQNNNAGESVDDGVRYRMGDFTPRDRKIAADVYDKMVSSARFEFSEAMQDSEEGKKYLTAKSFFKSKEGVSQRAMLLHEYSTPTFVTDGATLFNDTKIPNFLIFRLI